MADIGITKFRVQIPRGGAIPSTPGFAQSEGQDPVNPPGSPTGIYVPYLGATGAVNLGEFGLTTGNLIFDTTPTNIPTAQGAMYWDADDETVALIMNGAIQKVGEDAFYQVKNQTGSNIAKGVAVRFAGTVGNSGRLLIAPFLADGTYPSTYFMGVTMEAIANGDDGKVMWFGRIRGINTNAYNEGDILYASTTVAGGFQTTIPQAPNNIVEICAVVTKSATVGTIFIRPTLGSNINRDEGVKIVSGATGDLLQLQASGLWENKTVSSVIGTLASKWTSVGSDIYRNSRVLVGGTTFDHANSILEIQHSTDNYVKGLTIVNSRSWGYGSRITFRVPLASGVGGPADAAAIQQGFESSNNFNLTFWTTNSGILSLKMYLTALGNLLIGGNGTDAGFKLDVVGTARIQNELTLDVVNDGLGHVLLRGLSNKVVKADLIAGMTWRDAVLSTSYSWDCVCYGKGIFVAGGSSGRIAISQDGDRWFDANSSISIQLRSITFGEGLFVAIGGISSTSTSLITTSPDGVTWTTRTSAHDGNNFSFARVCYGNGRFVAVSSQNVQYSNDGISWVNGTLPAGYTTGAFSNIAYGNKTFVAVRNAATKNVMYSTDGITWVFGTDLPNSNWSGVAYWRGRFYAKSIVSSDYYTSPDGITWTLLSQPVGTTSGSVLVTGNGVLLALSPSSATTGRLSFDGSVFYDITCRSFNADACYGNGVFVTVRGSETVRATCSGNIINPDLYRLDN